MPRNDHTQPANEPTNDADPDAVPCPGTCNSAWRAAERRRLAKGTEHELNPRDGKPVWCPACTAGIRGTFADWPRLAAALVAEIESGVSAGLGEYVSGSKERPVHDHEAPSILLDEVAEYLSAWENTIRDQRRLGTEQRWSAQYGDGHRDPHRNPVTTIALTSAFLTTHLDWLLGERPPGEETVAEDFGQMLLDYHRRAQRLTGTGTSQPLRVLGVPCPNCDRCALEYEIEPEASRRGRLKSFVYDEAGNIRLLHPLRPQWPVRGAAEKLTETVTKPLEGAMTGYIACRRCQPVFRMPPEEYTRWTRQLAHDSCTRGMTTRRKLSIVFGGKIPAEYLKALTGQPDDPGDEPPSGRTRLRQPSPADHRFAPDSWAPLIGKPVLVTLPGAPPETVERILLAAVVSDDGSSVELTFENDNATTPEGEQ